MGWIPLAMGVAGGLMQADKEKQIRKQNMARAASNAYAGIRNSKGQEQGGRQAMLSNTGGGFLGGALQGGLSGFGMQQAAGGAGSWFPKGTASTGNFANVAGNGSEDIANQGFKWSALQKNMGNPYT